MNLDFSHLNYTEDVDVLDRKGNVLFTVTVGEVTHGQKADIQMKMMQSINMPTMGTNKSKNQKQLQASIQDAMQSGSVLKTSMYEELAAIKAWTLTNAQGESVPVCFEAWQSLPVFITSQVEGVIERLNPSIDDEFQSES